MKPVRTWILIADGAQARVVMNDGPGHGIKSVKGMKFNYEHGSPTEQAEADRAGKSGNSGKPAPVNSKDTALSEKRSFAEQLGHTLQEKLNQKAYDRMIIFASPAMLGELRSALSSHVMEKVITQVPKDLTNIPTRHLTKHIEDVLAI